MRRGTLVPLELQRARLTHRWPPRSLMPRLASLPRIHGVPVGPHVRRCALSLCGVLRQGNDGVSTKGVSPRRYGLLWALVDVMHHATRCPDAEHHRADSIIAKTISASPGPGCFRGCGPAQTNDILVIHEPSWNWAQPALSRAMMCKAPPSHGSCSSQRS